MREKTTQKANVREPAKRRRFALALLAGAIGATTPALAQQIPASVRTDERVSFSISAQSLSSALSDYARQAGVNALYLSDELRGLHAPPLAGSFTRQEALDRLLRGSGFSGRVDGANLVLVQDASRPQRESAAASGAETAQGEPDTSVPNDQEEIVVTGTRIRGAPPAGANVISIDRDAIEQSGRTSVAGLLATLPQVSSVAQNDMTQLSSPLTASNIAFGSGVNLRGLGADATLTLVDGRRLAAAATGNFIDVSAIPLAAVERVEVLADGASATYGSDAVGGVVNIILRRDFTGAETRLRYGEATEGGAEDFGFSHLMGHAWARGSVVGAYEYRERGPLAKADRAVSASSDLTPFGGGDYSGTFENPGNIVQIGATSVTLAIPAGQDGRSLSEADLLPGVVNLHNENEGAFLMPRQEIHSVFFSGRYEPAPDLELFFDALVTQRNAGMADAQQVSTITVPETNAFRVLNNLFPGQGPMRIQYNFTDDLGALRYDTETRDRSVILGGAYSFDNAWRVELSGAHSSHVDEVAFYNVIDTLALAGPLASGDLTTAFNPFGDGSHTNAAVLAGLDRRQDTANDSTVEMYALRADGPLFDLPGGMLRAAFGIERREVAFSIRRFGTRASGAIEIVPTQRPAERVTDAVYGELYAPLLDTLALSLSVRHERSSDFGESTNPKIGFAWQATPALQFHGSWGTSFKAPLFLQLMSITNTSYSTDSATFDPYATNGSTGTLTLSGGNPNLKPETAEIWTAGFRYAPSWAPGLDLDVTYFDIDFADRVSTPGSRTNAYQSPVSFGGYFIRNPTPEQIAAALALDSDGLTSGAPPADGVEAIFDGRQINLANQRVRGADFSLSYLVDADTLGEFTLSIGASALFQFTSRANPSSPEIDSLNTIFNQVDLRGRASLGWRRDAWAANVAVNYTDDYENNLPLIPERIGAWTTLDARLAYEWGNEGDEAGTQLSLFIQNLTDEDPPFVDNPLGLAFDTLNASPVGRFISVELVRRW